MKDDQTHGKRDNITIARHAAVPMKFVVARKHQTPSINPIPCKQLSQNLQLE